MKIKVALTFCLAIFSYSSFAQNPSPSHLKASEALVGSFMNQKMLEDMYQTVFSGFLSQVPAEKKERLQNTLLNFVNKYANYETLKPHYVDIYAKEFSEAELKELTTFFQSPAGKKYLLASPRLMKKGMEVGQQVMLEHQQELQAAIQESMAK